MLLFLKTFPNAQTRTYVSDNYRYFLYLKVLLKKYIDKNPYLRENPWSVYRRYLRWQLYSGLSGRDMLVPFIENLRLKLRRGYHASTGNYYLGLREFEEMSFLLHFLREDELFVDVGANIGAYSLLASGICGAASIAFEPDDDCRQFLKEQIAINKLQNLIRTDGRVVGAEEEFVFFSEGRGMNNQVLSGGGKKKEQVVLDQLLAEKYPALIKVDVEGFEHAVFSGMQKLLKRESLRALIVELDGKGEEEREQWVLDLLMSEGFKAYQYEVANRALTPAGRIHTGNFLFIRDLDLVQEKLKQAPTFSFFGKRL